MLIISYLICIRLYNFLLDFHDQLANPDFNLHQLFNLRKRHYQRIDDFLQRKKRLYETIEGGSENNLIMIVFIIIMIKLNNFAYEMDISSNKAYIKSENDFYFNY